MFIVSNGPQVANAIRKSFAEFAGMASDHSRSFQDIMQRGVVRNINVGALGGSMTGALVGDSGGKPVYGSVYWPPRSRTSFGPATDFRLNGQETPFLRNSGTMIDAWGRAPAARSDSPRSSRVSIRPMSEFIQRISSVNHFGGASVAGGDFRHPQIKFGGRAARIPPRPFAHWSRHMVNETERSAFAIMDRILKENAT